VRSGTLAFFFGILIYHVLPESPSPWWALLLPVAVVALGCRWLRLSGLAAAGFLWVLLWVALNAELPLPSRLESADLTAEGWVASLPEPANRRVRFQLAVKALSDPSGAEIPFTGTIQLSWYADQPPMLRIGDRWRMSVRLKRPRGLANPGGFDFERWLFVQRIVARGYVRTSPRPRLLARAERFPVGRVRQAIAEDFHRLLPNRVHRALLTALAVGDRSAIEADQWKILQRTGTGHLMAISGLHIGLVAGLGFFVGRRTWAWLPRWNQHLAASDVGALGALAAAGGYALLAGMSLPTQRALLMVATVMLAQLWRRSVVPSRILALALLLVLVWDPVAPLAGGFWLSFGAVAVILYSVCGRLASSFGLRHWVALQLAITLALIPATLVLFQSVSIVSPLANLIAIPWVSVTVVPLTLMAIVAGFVSELARVEVLGLAALSVQWLWNFLELMGAPEWSLQSLAEPPWWALILALPGLLLLLSPRGAPGRWVGAVLCLPLLWFPRAAPAPGDIWFTLLDVGQGLAAVIRTTNHVLVYDTGPRVSWRFDAGRAVVTPFLRRRGIARIDTLILSHADAQHTGGARSVLEDMNVGQVLTSLPREVPVQDALACRAGRSWTWDDVRFDVLHPPAVGFRANDASCVLRVRGRDGTVLLPGDIGPSAGRALLESYGSTLRADVLVAPDHGGAGIALPELLTVVKPRYVLFSTGYRNRFGYPKPATMQLYRASGARVLNTARRGAIMLRLESGRHDLAAETHREQARRHWHSR
jgi:competence protein ComEC